MKISERDLRRIIKEELNFLPEGPPGEKFKKSSAKTTADDFIGAFIAKPAFVALTKKITTSAQAIALMQAILQALPGIDKNEVLKALAGVKSDV
jgi:hypothetical protein